MLNRNKYFDELIKNNAKLERGADSILDAYEESLIDKRDYLIVEDLTAWNHTDYDDIAEILEEGNVTEIAIAEKSTALMQHLANFDLRDWKLDKMICYNGYRGLERNAVLLRKDK